MKSIQAALGIETSSSNMKGLQVFIADIRNCANKDQEAKRVDKELAKIRLKFTNAKSLSGYDKKKYVWKLLYAYMLGYDIDFGHFQAVELCSSEKFSEKTAGYLAISLLLADNAETLRLVVNSVKTDMISHNEHIAALALNTVANIGGAEFADNLFADISKIVLNPAQYSPYLKRKACICLLRLYRRDQDALQPEMWSRCLATLFGDRDNGLLTSLSGFVLAILEQSQNPVGEWLELVPPVVKCLVFILEDEGSDTYDYYGVRTPWLQTKLLRILQFFDPHAFNDDILAKINAVLMEVMSTGRPEAQRTFQGGAGANKKRSKADAERQNRTNAEHSILFEAMNVAIHLEDRCFAETTRTASTLLGAFISSNDPNIRYLALETMARLARNPNTHEYLEKYKNMILEKMHETDISIRRQALNLLYALCRPGNWQQIVDELLEILGASDALLQEEMVLKIAIIAEKNAPNFRWYVDVIFRMLQCAPESVGDDVWYRVVQVVTGFEDGVGDRDKQELQRYAAGKAFQSLTGPYPHETLVKLGAYLIGEFGHQLPQNIPPKAKLDALSRHYMRASGQVKAIILLASVKMLNANDELKGEVGRMLRDVQDEQDMELQQRACELLQLAKDEDLLDEVLCPMPQYAESVQQNNPLVQRLKFQLRSRAHTRAQLEHAAKSEGGVLKSGVGLAKRGDGGAEGGGGPDGPLALGDRGPGGRQGNDDADSSDSDSSDEDRGARGSGGGGTGAGAAGNGGAAGADPKNLWQQLCIMPQGKLFVSSGLSIELKQEYSAFTGRLTFNFLNAGREPISNIRIRIPEVPYLQSQQFSEPPTALAPQQQAQHHLQVQCVQPFLQPAKYLVEYTDASRRPQLVSLMLPAIVTKFMTPAEVQLQQFRSVFESMNGAQQEYQSVGQAKVPPAQWPNYMQRGFNLHLLRENTPQASFAAGTLHTSTPDPQQADRNLTAPVLVRVEYDGSRQMVRLTCRSQHGELSNAVGKIIETYLIIPQQRANGS